MHAVAYGTELERGALCARIGAVGVDQRIGRGRVLNAALYIEVLQVDDGRAARVLVQVGRRVFARELYPAGVQLGLEVLGGHRVV